MTFLPEIPYLYHSSNIFLSEVLVSEVLVFILFYYFDIDFMRYEFRILTILYFPVMRLRSEKFREDFFGISE